MASGSSVLSLGGLAAESAVTRSVAVKRRRVLVLGATGFIGPHFVKVAVERGHAVSVFLYKHHKNPQPLSPGIEGLQGDRNGDLKSISNREWDIVLDLATYVPNWVRTLGDALRGRVGHYTFISSIRVYEFPGATDENSKLMPYTDLTDPYALTSQSKQYGPLKTLCEREAEKQFAGRTLVLRPGHIIGPGEKTGSFTYLPARMEQGGEILAAGTHFDPVQMIDARDLAEWAIRMAERSESGTFNVTGPHLPMRWGEMLGAVRGIFSVPLTLTWVPIPWLRERNVGVYSPLLYWPTELGTPGANRINIDKARGKGLTFRPLCSTAADTLAWYKTLSPERQEAALIGFNGHASLADSMAREQDLLDQWRAQRRA